MKLFKYILILISGLVLYVGEANAIIDSQNNLELVADFSNSYRTYGDFLNAMTALQVFSQQDKIEIEKMLSRNNIVLNDQMTNAKIVENEKIQWGNTELVYDKKQAAYRTKLGSFLRQKTGESISERFVRILEAIDGKCKNCSVWNHFFIESSYAAEVKNSKFDAALVWTAHTVLAPGVFCPSAVFANLVGGASNVLKSIIYPIRQFLYDGKVECDGTSYKVKNMKFELMNPITATKDFIEDEDFKKILTNPVARGCAGAYTSGLVSFYSLFYTKGVDCLSLSGCNVFVSDKVLKDTFGEEIPPCNNNKDNAKKVQLSMKAKAEQMESTTYSKLKTGTTSLPESTPEKKSAVQ